MSPSCPYCGKAGDDRCGHLLVRVSSGGYVGEVWAAKVVPSLAGLDEAEVSAGFLQGLLEAVSEPAESEPGETCYWAAEPAEAATTIAKVLLQSARQRTGPGEKRRR